MDKLEFSQALNEHDLDVMQFLDLRDEWNALAPADKLELLKKYEQEHD